MFKKRNSTQNFKLMKKITLISALLFISTFMFAQQTARVQIIHNSADLAADTVDVWLNDQLLIDNFASVHINGRIPAVSIRPLL